MIPQHERSAAHRAILEAAVARLLPSEDGPGAAEARVVDYIENALEDRWHAGFEPLLRRGLDFFDHLARQQAGQPFVDCTPEQQDEILHQVQRFPNNDARHFFQKLIELTVEGFLCDPRHGGNHELRGWRYIGRGRSTRCMEERSA